MTPLTRRCVTGRQWGPWAAILVIVCLVMPPVATADGVRFTDLGFISTHGPVDNEVDKAAVDPLGHIYTIDPVGAVRQFNPTTGITNPFASSVTASDIVAAPTGEVFVLSPGDDTVRAFNPASGAETRFIDLSGQGGIGSDDRLAVSNTHIYLTDPLNDAVREFDFGGGPPTQTFQDPGLTIDPDHRVYFTEGNILVGSGSNHTTIAVDTGATFTAPEPIRVTFVARGNVFLNDGLTYRDPGAILPANAGWDPQNDGIALIALPGDLQFLDAADRPFQRTNAFRFEGDGLNLFDLGGAGASGVSTNGLVATQSAVGGPTPGSIQDPGAFGLFLDGTASSGERYLGYVEYIFDPLDPNAALGRFRLTVDGLLQHQEVIPLGFGFNPEVAGVLFTIDPNGFISAQLDPQGDFNYDISFSQFQLPDYLNGTWYGGTFAAAVPVPEPGTGALLGVLALGLLAGTRGRRKLG